jgi:hypothetical protein
MFDTGRWRRSLAQCLLALGLASQAGCLSCMHPVEPPEPHFSDACQTVPVGCRNHVYVFLMNGLDPINYGNLTGLRDYVQELGFGKTYYGQLFHAGWFEKEIRRIHQDDEDARVVLIGFSLGVQQMHSVAKDLNEEGIPIDLLIFLSGNHPVAFMPEDRPANVHRVVNILASGSMKAYGVREYAENVRLPEDTWHFGSPTHPYTLEKLSEELAALALTVPLREIVRPQQPPDEEAPKPRPVKPPSDEEAPKPRPVKPPSQIPTDEWDFLKPVSFLQREHRSR